MKTFTEIKLDDNATYLYRNHNQNICVVLTDVDDNETEVVLDVTSDDCVLFYFPPTEKWYGMEHGGEVFMWDSRPKFCYTSRLFIPADLDGMDFYYKSNIRGGIFLGE